MSRFTTAGSETKELAKKIQVLHLQAEEGTGKVGEAKACDFHTSSSDNPDMHLKHRCDLQVERSGMRKCRRREEGHPSFVPHSAPSPGMQSLHTPVLLGSSCLCWWIFAYRHFIYLVRKGEMNLMMVTLVTKFCGGHSGYRISESEHQTAIIQARSTAAQPQFMEDAASEIYVRTESSSHSSFYSPLRELRQTHFP